MLGLVRRAAEEDPRLKRKAAFLSRYGDEYGYGGRIDILRGAHFSRLGGATLYSEQQLRAAMQDLTQSVYSNPHSLSPSSINTAKLVHEVREQILKFFNVSAKDYSVVFTSGATAALKLVGECFPWSDKSEFRYALKSHNSVLGIREYAISKGASFSVVEMEKEEEKWNQQQYETHDRPEDDSTASRYNLFAFPGECNFSGAKYSLEWVNRYHNKQDQDQSRWLVLVDCAALASNTPVDLARYSADFVVVSFYKIFGYPTGIGALIVRNKSAALLNKTFFGGGTVEASLSTERYHVLRKIPSERFEDGTIPFTSIVALKYGFDILLHQSVPGGMTNIQRHTFSLSQYLYKQLSELRHYNLSPAAVVYGRHHLADSFKQGPIVTFNLRKASGAWIGHKEVERLAGMENIHIRAGCFCNPGACHFYLGLSPDDVKQNLQAGHICGDDIDIIKGTPTGAIRVSIGYMSTWEDVDAFLSFVMRYFIESAPPSPTDEILDPEAIKRLNLSLEKLIVYPIKSCKGVEVRCQWEIGEQGFAYDREWMIVDENGSGLNQKKAPKLCQIQPTIEIEQDSLYLDAPGMERLSLALSYFPEVELALDVCGDAGSGRMYTDVKIQEWLEQFLSVKCMLVRKSPAKLRKAGRSRSREEAVQEIAFANESQFLLVSENSVDDLNNRLLAKSSSLEVEATRFRPNIILSRTPSLPPYAEDSFLSIAVGDQIFTALGQCGRCRMVGINQATGQFNKEPLLTLASYRRSQGMIMFGLLLVHDKNRSPLPHVVHLDSSVRVLNMRDQNEDTTC